jgi:hypothetical protein
MGEKCVWKSVLAHMVATPKVVESLNRTKKTCPRGGTSLLWKSGDISNLS